MGGLVGLGSPRYPAQVDMQQVHIKPLQLIGAIGNHPSVETKENRWTRGAHAALFMQLLAARTSERSAISSPTASPRKARRRSTQGFSMTARRIWV